MLYVTTRNGADTHTAHQALQGSLTSDGGLYIPFRLPRISTEILMQMRSNSMSETVAQILNMFFPAKFTAADVAECAGFDSARLVGMSHKIILAELWNSNSYILDSVSLAFQNKILGTSREESISDWAKICCRIAYLFGIYGMLLAKNLADGVRALDLAVVSDDFSAPMAAWYAREMGLPIGMIICGCEDNSDVWDLLHRKELHCNCNTTPAGLERLIYGVFGQQDAQRFADACRSNKLYTAPLDTEEELGQGIFAAVVSNRRVDAVIRNVFNTNAYVLSPSAALAFGGLQDYRATCGDSTPALILADQSPLASSQFVAESLGITISALEKMLQQQGGNYGSVRNR